MNKITILLIAVIIVLLAAFCFMGDFIHITHINNTTNNSTSPNSSISSQTNNQTSSNSKTNNQGVPYHIDQIVGPLCPNCGSNNVVVTGESKVNGVTFYHFTCNYCGYIFENDGPHD